MCILCQQTSPKRWFGNTTMTSFCDVTNSAHQIQMTTLCHWMKLPPMKSFCVRHCIEYLLLGVGFLRGFICFIHVFFRCILIMESRSFSGSGTKDPKQFNFCLDETSLASFDIAFQLPPRATSSVGKLSTFATSISKVASLAWMTLLQKSIGTNILCHTQCRNWRGDRGGSRPPWPVISKFLGPLSPHC